MKPDPESQLLKDPDLAPTPEVLESKFGSLYPLYVELINLLESDDLGLATEWRYYKDGKAWLCKITRKKKTAVWMSAWQDHLHLGFYFTEKTGAGIPDLEIDPALKESYATADPIGKMKPLTVELKNTSQLKDLRELLRYKISKL
ncbi:MAG: DUF3788 family protein [Lysobacterales bacterium]|jgi:hypothetical protein